MGLSSSCDSGGYLLRAAAVLQRISASSAICKGSLNATDQEPEEDEHQSRKPPARAIM
jgi:hypothetical protein